MRSRLGMSAYYQKKEGGGQDLSPCPGGSGTNTLTYFLFPRRLATAVPCTSPVGSDPHPVTTPNDAYLLPCGLPHHPT